MVVRLYAPAQPTSRNLTVILALHFAQISTTYIRMGEYVHQLAVEAISWTINKVDPAYQAVAELLSPCIATQTLNTACYLRDAQLLQLNILQITIPCRVLQLVPDLFLTEIQQTSNVCSHAPRPTTGRYKQTCAYKTAAIPTVCTLITRLDFAPLDVPMEHMV